MKDRFLLALAILALLAPAASADTLDVVKGTSGWRPFVASNSSGWSNGTAGYYDAWSYDGETQKQCNIGYWLTGTGVCGISWFRDDKPSADPSEYLGDSDTGFKLTKSGWTESVTVTRRTQVTAYAATDEFGWFELVGDTIVDQTPFTFVGKTATFIPTGSYGFYVKSPEGTYYSTGAGDTRTHIATFKLVNGNLLFGSEDMWTYADFDYNDVAYEVHFNDVPEPTTFVLLGTGLVGLIGRRLRRRR